MWRGELRRGDRNSTFQEPKNPQIVADTGTRFTNYYIYQIIHLAVKKKSSPFLKKLHLTFK
jgi:hypothetical protein